MQIEHDPEEPQIDRGPGPWRIAIPVMLAVVALNLATREIDWVSLLLGAGVGGCVVAWAIDVTGNKTPDFMRSKPPRAGRS